MILLSLMVDVEELVEARCLQRGGPLVFCFPYDPFVSLFDRRRLASVPQTNVSASTYSTFVTELLKNSTSSGPQS